MKSNKNKLQKVLALWTLFVFSIAYTNTQSDYWYVLRNSYGDQLSYYVHRTYLSKNIFVDEKYLLHKKKLMEVDTFKISNGILFHCFDGEFYDFVSVDKFKRGDTCFLRNEFFRKNIEKSRLNEYFIYYDPYKKVGTEYIFKDISETPINPAPNEIYGLVFDPKKGIVAELCGVFGRYDMIEVLPPF